MIKAPSLPETPWLEKSLVAAVLIAAIILAVLEWKSELAIRRRANLPLFAWVKLQPANTAPLDYVLSYHWNRRILEIVYFPSSHSPQAVRSVALPVVQTERTFSWKIADATTGNDPRILKRLLRRAPRNFRYWMSLPSAVDILRKNTRPSISAYDAVLLFWEAYHLSPGGLRMTWISQIHTFPRLTQRLLGRAPIENPPSPATVEVLNASGEAGVALQATKILRWGGLDVMDFGNASSLAPTTQWIDRFGNPQPAKKAALLLGCDEPDIITQIESGHPTMLTLILGEDFKKCRSLGLPVPARRDNP